ncbi:branched-chain amino acid ABC transporter permease [Chromobacterium piscinae]|uniref:Branched-chain amino acid ABC transporter permease n=1 Tax=Chromobacterium piscinae TaxID=686831 RepID=A0ABV0HAN7_9NEIS|nr:branched-chain amino acid ABC transporter permease [Chromobacterium vaccinii]MCD4506593.1 branched-chain amino acid ABC transporter permease [Chromobacterium piscinae]MBX9347760.1 branched-chain amino acid ABC transporter permease [Chromobacterium vaccinii]MBX9356959.1 branched-chain amino acid ABC transporter permease [Chromobacterium vaccinii]MCD5330625.1 branched-chain amino acid ABC transporter permease [Chromobacterium piscinae]
MDIFLQQILNGLVLGSIYALIALGYTMVYGIMGLINFAHGEVVMFGAMVTITVITTLMGMGINLPGPALVLIGLLVAIPACMLLGFTIERIAYRPLRGKQRLAPLITAIGVSIVLQQVAILIWGRNYIPFPQILDHDVVTIFGASITKLQIVIIVLCLAIMAGLLLMVERTKLGRAMRATSQNPAVAGLMGVNVNTIISATFVIGSGLGAIAGVMVATNYEQAHYYMGFMIGLKAFTAAVLGGIGNLGGAVAGGILLGIIESLGAGYIGSLTGGFLGSNYQDIIAFMVLIAVLIFRPSGLLGEKMADRA